jgi:FSR family fosmidomycin resistance protein-like MFS transporter
VLQPLFGYLADRRPMPWMVWEGLLLAGVGVSLSTVAPSYPAALVLITVAGVGIAAFHPEATRATARVTAGRRATGMSVFALGGNVGFALAPLVVVPVASRFGLGAVSLLVVPALIMAGALVGVLRPTEAHSVPLTGRATGERTDAWGPFGRLSVAVVCRSVVFFGLNTFLPLYWAVELHQTKVAGGAALSLLLGAGMVGTLLGGRAADRFGAQRVVAVSFVLLGPLLWVLLRVSNPVVALILLVPVGLALYAPFSVMVTLGQLYLPNHIGTASGVTLGLAVAVGGVAAPWIGRLADRSGVAAALGVLVWVAVVAAGCAFTLPRAGSVSSSDR